MEKREILILVLIVLVIAITGVLIYLSLEKKIYHAPQFSPPDVSSLPLDTEFCFDSDNSLDYFNKGSAVWGIGDGEYHTSTDYCILDNDPTWPAGTLFEMYCDVNKFKIKDASCPQEYSCEDGACVR